MNRRNFFKLTGITAATVIVSADIISEEKTIISKSKLTIALFSEDKEINWKNYKRQPINFINNISFKNFENDNEISFFYGKGDPILITHIKIFENDNIIYHSQLAVSKRIRELEIFKFAKGDIKISLN